MKYVNLKPKIKVQNVPNKMANIGLFFQKSGNNNIAYEDSSSEDEEAQMVNKDKESLYRYCDFCEMEVKHIKSINCGFISFCWI